MQGLFKRGLKTPTHVGLGVLSRSPWHRNASQPITREALFKARLKCAKDCREKKKCANEATSRNSV